MRSNMCVTGCSAARDRHSTPTEAADAIQGLKTEVDQLRGEISQVHGVNQGALESQQAKYKEQIEKLAVLQVLDSPRTTRNSI